VNWFNRLFTDRDGEPDTGRVFGPMVIAVLCYNAVMHPETYHPAEFGSAVRDVLIGVAAYLWGDSRRPPG